MTTNRLVYLVGDNDVRKDDFKSLLHGFFPDLNIQALDRTAFWKLSTDKEAKFVFVFPHSTRNIIYDKNHSSRSFHQEIDKTDSEKTDAGCILP